MNSAKTLIKICGLSRLEDIDIANELLPEYIGFVFFEKSKRNVSKETARLLKQRLDKRIKAVGVFVDSDEDFICSLLDEGIIDIAQLHGSEDEDYIQRIKTRSGCKVIKAFVVNDLETFKTAENSGADYILLDSGKGTGNTFDWSILEGVKRPYFLAGGLNCDNIERVMSDIRPYAVDVSSGVETDGIKDAEKIRRFVSAVRKAL
ncbi:MAG: phosphoribosylanthranilate isomerase [Eubacterium sp.]|nr:phosphoribosylanthranilate isomerase [Eubacterium sp.]